MSEELERSRQAIVAGRIRATSFALPLVAALTAFGTGLWLTHPGVVAGVMVLTLGTAALRDRVAARVHRWPLHRGNRVTVGLAGLAGLEMGLGYFAYVVLYGPTAESFLIISAVLAVAAGGVANLAPSFPLQCTLLLSVVTPALVGALAIPTTPLSLSIALSCLFYIAFMLNMSRQIHRDYMGGHLRQLELEAQKAELEDARRTAEDSSRAKSAFLANMSHEIRTPLNGVLGMAQVLARTSLDREQKDTVATILHSGEGLLAVLNDILDFSKIESRKLLIEPVDFDPGLLVRRAAALFATAARDKGLTVSLELDAGLPARLRADELRIRQILLNTLSNAIKFTERGGVRMSAAWARGELMLSVSDTGPGMAPATLATLFQPFAQGDASTTRRHGGTGLGLVISLELARLMGGRFEAESTPGVGSRFTLTIPAAAAGPAPVEDAVSGPMAAPGGLALRVLVAEDNPVNQRVAQKLLEQLGCEAVVCGDGAEALDRLAEQPFSLVLMDCQMPSVDGYTAARTIREREAGTGRHLPIVGLTASAIDGDRERALDAGMDEYLTKPVKLASLEAVLARVARGVPLGA